MTGLIWTVIVLLVILWFLGFAVNIGWWINLLLILALLGIVYNLFVRPILLTQTHAREDVHIHRHHDDVDDEL